MQQNIHSSRGRGRRHMKKTLRPYSSLTTLLHCHTMTLVDTSSWNAPPPDVPSGGFSSAEGTLSQRGMGPPANNLPLQYCPLLSSGHLPIYEVILFVYSLSPRMAPWEWGLGFVYCHFFSDRTCPHLLNKYMWNEWMNEWREGIKIHTSRLSRLASFTDEKIKPCSLKGGTRKSSNATLPH